jgi:hypothetical protein
VARVKTPTCACEVFNGCVTKPCLMHVRWHRQRLQPARRLLAEALPGPKIDPHDWFARRDQLNTIIDTEG